MNFFSLLVNADETVARLVVRDDAGMPLWGNAMRNAFAASDIRTLLPHSLGDGKRHRLSNPLPRRDLEQLGVAFGALLSLAVPQRFANVVEVHAAGLGIILDGANLLGLELIKRDLRALVRTAVEFGASGVWVTTVLSARFQAVATRVFSSDAGELVFVEKTRDERELDDFRLLELAQDRGWPVLSADRYENFSECFFDIIRGGMVLSPIAVVGDDGTRVGIGD